MSLIYDFKNQIFLSLIFAIAPFVSFSLISALILWFVSFSKLLVSSFCVCFRCKSRVFLWCSSSSFRQAYMLCISLTLLVTESKALGYRPSTFICLYLHLISILISFVICWLFRCEWFSLHMFGFLCFPLQLTPNLTSLWMEKMLEILSFYLLLFEFTLCSFMGQDSFYPGGCSVALEKRWSHYKWV